MYGAVQSIHNLQNMFDTCVSTAHDLERLLNNADYVLASKTYQQLRADFKPFVEQAKSMEGLLTDMSDNEGGD